MRKPAWNLLIVAAIFMAAACTSNPGQVTAENEVITKWDIVDSHTIPRGCAIQTEGPYAGAADCHGKTIKFEPGWWGAKSEDANLAGSNFAGARIIQSQFVRAQFENANMAGATIEHTNLAASNFNKANMAGVVVSKSSLSGSLEEANLRGSTFRGVVLHIARAQGARFDDSTMMDVDASGDVWFQNASFAHSTISNSAFKGAKLHGAIFNKTKLERVDFGESDRPTDLSEAVFVQSDVNKANFANANLERINMAGSTLSTSFFAKTTLANANMSSATLRSNNFTGANLAGVAWNSVTCKGGNVGLGSVCPARND